MAMLEVRDLSVWVRTHRGQAAVVRNLSFDLEAGATLGMIGESGSGKSMAVLAMMGLLPSNAWATGSIIFNGQELVGAKESLYQQLRGKAIGMVFQDPVTALNPLQRVGNQIAESLRWHHKLPKAAALDQAVALMERVGIANAAQRVNDYPHQFSGGQRQRILIASALVCSPQLLIADEPTTALDATVQAQVLQLLKELVAERQMAMLFISHDLALVAHTVQQLLVLYSGEMVEQGAISNVLRSSAHPYTRALLAARPQLGRLQDGPLPTISGQMPSPFDAIAGCRFAPRCPLAQPACQQTTVLHTVSPAHTVRCTRWKDLP